jgi:hypothetical protein
VESLLDDLRKAEREMEMDHSGRERKMLINNSKWILTSKSIHSWPLKIKGQSSDKTRHNGKRK